MDRPTDEQLRVICHPVGSHARVQGVAGSGKTTTLAMRVQHLVESEGVDPGNIVVLLYNSFVRRAFEDLLDRHGPTSHPVPQVHSFHSCAHTVIQRSIAQGDLPYSEAWMGRKEARALATVQQAIEHVRGPGPSGEAAIDPEEALDAISLWKASLIPPERAGFDGHPLMADVYAEFERLRVEANVMTADDLVPTAVRLLGADPTIGSGRAELVIVDDYQDVNLAQHRLIEVLAGERADVMVAGDDDQTIHEWRGARSTYLVGEFGTAFGNKPRADYALSRSFRLGPVIAQAAENVVSFCSRRVPKTLIAADAGLQSAVTLITDRGDSPMEVDRAMTNRVETLLGEQGVPAHRIAVLVRMLVQFAGLEAEFLKRGIPYRVVGAKPFFKRREVLRLADHIRLASNLRQPLDKEGIDHVFGIINAPWRVLPEARIEEQLVEARERGLSLGTFLGLLVDGAGPLLTAEEQGSTASLLAILEQVHEWLVGEQDFPAGALLQWLWDALDYDRHFDRSLGSGEHAADRKLAAMRFIDYVDEARIPATALLHHLARLDPTRGVPTERQVTMMPIIKAKGLEYDYVLMPLCAEDYLPCRYRRELRVHDSQAVVEEAAPPASIDNERRLFFVGLTRAKKAVMVGVSSRVVGAFRSEETRPSRFVREMQLGSVDDILPGLQRLAAGDESALTPFLTGVRRSGGCDWARCHLVPNYVQRLGSPELTAQVEALLRQTPNQPSRVTATTIPSTRSHSDRHRP